MDAHERLRHLGWSKRQRDDFLADCTDQETASIAAADTGDQLRKVLDEIADARTADTETDEPEPEKQRVREFGEIGD